MDAVIVGAKYKHLKRGGIYEVLIDGALIEATMTCAVVYRCIEDGRVWVRARGEFMDGRFQQVLTAARIPLDQLEG